MKKKETKLQELERRIKALENHQCNPMPIPQYNYPKPPPPVPYQLYDPCIQIQGYCLNCGMPLSKCRGHAHC